MPGNPIISNYLRQIYFPSGKLREIPMIDNPINSQLRKNTMPGFNKQSNRWIQTTLMMVTLVYNPKSEIKKMGNPPNHMRNNS